MDDYFLKDVKQMRIKELSQKQVPAVLINDCSKGGGFDHEGETLAEFIELFGLPGRSSVSLPSEQ